MAVTVVDMNFIDTHETRQAKAAAQDQGKWLMISINAADEFASHMMNRDLFSNQGMRNIWNLVSAPPLTVKRT